MNSRSGIKKDYLSKENTNSLRGIFAVAVLFHHLSDHIPLLTEETKVYSVFGAMGYLSVGVFFFLSGYGMMISYKKFGITYAKNLFRKRIIPFYIVSLGFAAVDLFFTDRSLTAAIKLFYNFGLTGFLWYLQAQLVIYIIFWLVFSRNLSIQLKIVLLFVFVLFSICLWDYLQWGLWWIESTACYFVGVIWAENREEIDRIIFKKYNLLFSICLSIALFLFFYMSKIKFTVYTGLLNYSFSAVFFVISVVLLSSFVPVSNIFTRFLGKISLEIYATQHLVMVMFSGGLNLKIPFVGFNITKNGYLYCVAVILGTVLVSAIIHPLVSKFRALNIWQPKE